MNFRVLIAVLCSLTAFAAARDGDREETLPYTIIDTGQVRAYDNQVEIAYPKADAAFFGQDAHYQGVPPSYRDNGDGTVTDLNTGLMWQADPGEKRSLKQAEAGAAKCRTGGHTDWRLPTIKELYSLILFSGTDPDPTSRESGSLTPFIDTKFFKFEYGSESEGERIIDSQYATSTRYKSTTMGGDATVFGVNFADGRIKGYPLASPHGRGDKLFCVLYVRGNPKYGENDFKDNGDGTVTDRATGLVWMKVDSGALLAGRGEDGKLNWQEALAFAEKLEYAGHDDWRLPNAKELQSIVDYTRSPDTSNSPAIDPVFQSTPIKNEGGHKDYAHYWTGTSHGRAGQASAAVYIAFGRGLGFMSPPGRRDGEKQLMDVHGAGAQRSDDKSGDPTSFPEGRGPQGDVVRIENLVRCVRGGTAEPRESGPEPLPAAEPRPDAGPGGDRGEHDGPPPDGPGRPEGGRPSFMDREDRNGDGKVTRSEFRGPAEHFDRFDRNGDGVITEDEAPTGPPPGERGERGGRRRQSRSEPRGEEMLSVTTIGTGSPLYNPDRSSPAAMIEYAGRRILVDMGEGTARLLQKNGVALGTVDAVCFTHHHRDHDADAMSILPLMWLRGNAAPIYGPSGTGKLVNFIHEFYREDLAYRSSGRRRSGAEPVQPVAKELEGGDEFRVGDIRVRTANVNHSIETLAYRFDVGEVAITISGDLSYSESLIELADGCDILVMDSGGIVYTDSNGGSRPRARENGSARRQGSATPRAHATLEEVAKMAEMSGAARLVLTHFRPGTVDTEETVRRMAKIYSGRIEFGEDMKAYR